MEDKKKKIGLVIATMLLVLVFVVGMTYALIIFTGGSDINTIKTGKISMNYTESSNVINITNALPITDEVGKNQTDYFDFSVTSNADTNADDSKGIKIPYNLIVEPKVVDSDKDALTNEQIKVYLTKVEGGVETEVVGPTKISALTPVDTNFNLYSTENVHKNNNGMITTNYRLRAWIDYNVESKDWNQASKPKQYKFGVNVNATGEINSIAKPAAAVGGAKTIIDKAGTDGIVTESHPATEQLQATTDYRYTGANPNNYVSFNDELWRIIGVFDVDDGTGNLERRIKITRKEYIGETTWGFYGTSYTNDWTKSSGMTLLNSGDYWNKTGDYESNGLTDGAKAMISDAKWYLGGGSQIGLASDFYLSERGKTVFNTARPISWTGKVGLMYPSDYGYGTSGGTTTNRAACLTTEVTVWYGDVSAGNECSDNDWLLPPRYSQLTITPRSDYSNMVFIVSSAGFATYDYVDRSLPICPSIYLKSDIKIIGGTGSESDPYQLSL